MNDFARAVYSVIRKPFKTFTLFAVLVFICNLWLAAGASGNATVYTQDEAKKAVGVSFRLEINENNRHKRLETDGILIDLPNGSQLSTTPNNQFDSLLMDDIEKIAAVKGIVSYNVTTVSTPVNPINFNRIEDENRDQSSDFKGVNLYGNLNMEKDFNVINGNIRLVKGRYIQNGDENVVVISQELAKLNNLDLGDKIELNSCSYPIESEVYSATILGIFETLHGIPSLLSGDTFRSENTIFTDLRFPEKPSGDIGDPLYKYATFDIGNSDEYDKVKERVKQIGIRWDRYDFIDNNGISQQMSSNFSNIDSITTTMRLMVSISGFLILFFIFVFWIHNRKHEIGILLSIGKSKKNIISQFLMEAFMIGTVAFVISIFTVPAISEYVNRNLTEQQEQSRQESLKDTKGMTAGLEKYTEGVLLDSKVNITISMIMEMGVTMYILLIVAINCAGIIIIVKKPLNILSDMN